MLSAESSELQFYPIRTVAEVLSTDRLVVGGETYHLYGRTGFADRRVSKCGVYGEYQPKDRKQQEELRPCLTCFPDAPNYKLIEADYIPLKQVFEEGYVVARYGHGETYHKASGGCQMTTSHYYVTDSMEGFAGGYYSRKPKPDDLYRPCKNCFKNTTRRYPMANPTIVYVIEGKQGKFTTADKDLADKLAFIFGEPYEELEVL